MAKVQDNNKQELEEVIDPTELGEYPVQRRGVKWIEDLANERWRDDLDEYPLRDKSEDPRWAVNIVKLWTGAAIFFIVFLTVMITLGAILD